MRLSPAPSPLTESAVSTFEDELGWGRKKSTVLIGGIMLLLGSLSALGYGPLASVTILGMPFLDFFDFLTNSVMMPIAAIAICLLVSRGDRPGQDRGRDDPERPALPPQEGLQLYDPLPVPHLLPPSSLASSVANAFGWISM